MIIRFVFVSLSFLLVHTFTFAMDNTKPDWRKLAAASLAALKQADKLPHEKLAIPLSEMRNGSYAVKKHTVSQSQNFTDQSQQYDWGLLFILP